MAKKKWIQDAKLDAGAFTKKAKAAGMDVQAFARHVKANPKDYDEKTIRQANLALTLRKMSKK